MKENCDVGYRYISTLANYHIDKLLIIEVMKKLTIALVAHDNRKADMVEWAIHNAEFLSHHHIVCTGTTGNLVRKAMEEKVLRQISPVCIPVRWVEMPKLQQW